MVMVLQPRFGISMPVHEKSVVHLNYGQFMQRPGFRYIYYFYELRNDPLFPLFKKPIDGYIEDIILQKLEKEDILYNLLNRQIKTKPEKDFYSKWLNFYFEHIPERIIFWLVIETNKNAFRKTQYWGGMHYRANSCSDGVWPIEMYLFRIND